MILQQNISDFIRDFGLPIAGIIIALTIYILQTKKKALSYEIISTSSVLRVHDEVKDRLTIYFDKKEVTELYLLILQVKNTGNVPIASKDFEVQIIFEFNKEAKILSNEIIEVYPEVLNYTIKGESNLLRIEPTLFNQSDYIPIKLLIEDYNEIKQIHGRIIGVPNITEITSKSRQNKVSRIWGFFNLALSIVAYYVIPFELRNTEMIFPVWFLGIIGSIAIIFPVRFHKFMDVLTNIPLSRRTSRITEKIKE